MKNKPLVSVIMPVYNGEKYLREAIESILNQTYKNFEFIIVDDGSTDNSVKIIKEYAKKDKRIRFFRNKNNLGTFGNYNYYIKNYARGKYIAIQEQDDISLKERFQLELDFLESHFDIVLAGGHINIIDSEGKIVGKRLYPVKYDEIKKVILLKSPFANPTIMIRKDVFIENGGYGDYTTAGDYDLWMRLIIEKELKCENLDKIVVNYRIHENQQKSKKTKIQLYETIDIQKKYLFRLRCFSFLALINHIFLYLLLFLPNSFVLWLFRKIEFKT
ncbi:MAG: hypothetical protein KatS3mg096_886 [Candidatus Parcubacteria bacterium]|nr:MAG: hypothetical protein KatS3mg096_886 [Candidatus Parcubacteria bacterium]